jgi:bifunctional non-homologous end joining protein LigD
MLATPLERGAALPAGPEWVFEVKWDGVRLLADTTRGDLRLFTRTERDVTTTYPDLAGLAAIQGALLDGEVIAMDGGRPSFEALGARMHVSNPARAGELAAAVPVTYMVFDVLTLYGVDLTGHPFAERRGTLERLPLPEHCLLSPVYDDGAALFTATRLQGLEGVVAKRRSGLYSPGRRSPDWVKAAHRLSRTALVGGWRAESTGSGRLGALLLGAPDGEGRLRYLGRAGSGLSGALAAHLTAVLAPLARTETPFADAVPPADARGATWCEPEVIAQVTYLARTPSGRLRHPVLRGVRADATPDPWEVA